jgi:hypothetical protein
MKDEKSTKFTKYWIKDTKMEKLSISSDGRIMAQKMIHGNLKRI